MFAHPYFNDITIDTYKQKHDIYIIRWCIYNMFLELIKG